MIFFEVELSGSGVFNGPITGVKLPLCDSLTEYEQIKTAFNDEEQANKGVLISEIFFQHGLSCLCWYTSYSPYITMGGASLSSETAGAALLEAQNILPGNKYAPQISDPYTTNVKFSDGTTFTLGGLGYIGAQIPSLYILVYLNKDTGEGKYSVLVSAQKVDKNSQGFHINSAGSNRGITYGGNGTSESFNSGIISNGFQYYSIIPLPR